MCRVLTLLQPVDKAPRHVAMQYTGFAYHTFHFPNVLARVRTPVVELALLHCARKFLALLLNHVVHRVYQVLANLPPEVLEHVERPGVEFNFVYRSGVLCVCIAKLFLHVRFLYL